MTTFERPVAVVTGATGGMGRIIVELLATDHRVIALGRNEEVLATLAENPATTAVAVEVTDYENAAAKVIAATPRVDVLVHAAAISHRLRVDQARQQDWDDHFAINVTAPALLTSALLPALRQHSGTVIFINSGAGHQTPPGHAVYAASKHALRAVADGLRLDESANGVRVSTVSPGPTDTQMLRASITAAGQEYEPDRYIDPASVARAVRFVVDAGPDTQLTDIAVRPRIEL